jgi:hypothetical protein
MTTAPTTRRDALRTFGALALVGCAPALPETAAPADPPTPRTERNPAMNFRPLMRLHLETAPTQELGTTAHGALSIFPVTGGSFEGDRLKGKVLSGGGDWVTKRPDGPYELDLRVTLETDDGALIHMTFSGIRDDANHYFRTLPRFETASPQYAFLNRLLAVGRGEIGPEGPLHVIEELV